jgi:hypothetical protein
MNPIKVGLMQLAVVLAAGVQIPVAMVTVDFEAFHDFDNLNGVNLGGVTLTNPSGAVEVHQQRFGVFYHSPSKAIASPCGLASVNPLIGVFDRPVSFVSLWGGDAGTYPDEMDAWELLAFDAPSGGRLVGRVSSRLWVGNPYRQLTIAAEKIWRFEANWTGPQYGIGYDDLQFEVVPEPSALVLVGGGFVVLLAYARRARRCRPAPAPGAEPPAARPDRFADTPGVDPPASPPREAVFAQATPLPHQEGEDQNAPER